MTLEEERVDMYKSIVVVFGALNRLASRASALISEDCMTAVYGELEKMDRLEQEMRAMIIRCHGDHYAKTLSTIYRENY